ncbi:uncharacterized protein LOC133188756 [Saccostrea echinata]|uniref:uncharacterized protein LOC133188756 n=1 Tax=Saccostrea echinata TaxID=191078 RepID=UPI002A8376F2|nr:uncharacterized protein LOC133188756 [Saccostrea echinata]
MKLARLAVGCGFFVIIIFSEVVATETITYEFGDTCLVFLKELDESVQYSVEYHGKPVSILCDDYSFHGKGDVIADEYKVCVTPQYFNDSDCAIELVYTSTLFGTPLQSVTCSKNFNTRFCGKEEDYLYINFKRRDGKSTSSASFKLLVTAEKVLDFGILVGTIVGGVLGGIVLIIILTGIVCVCLCGRKPTRGQVLETTQNTSGQAINQPGIPYATYSTQQSSNTTTLYPTGNYSTQYSSGNSTQQPFQYSQTTGSQP